MAINFPSSPTAGQVHNHAPGISFVYLNGRWNKAPLTTALPKNYIVNPSFQISQENGRLLGATQNYFVADQWQGIFNNTGGWVPQYATLALATPNGSVNMCKMQDTTAGTLGSADYFVVYTNLEGNRIADLCYGTANAKWSVLSFTVFANAGTYAVAVRNGAGNRSCVFPITISAGQGGTFVRFAFSIPPDTGGTWATDNSLGMQIDFTHSAGTSNRAPVAGVWNTSAGYLGVAGMTTNVDVLNKQLYFGDVGLYADPYKTGVAPLFKVPDEATELRRCQRYWAKIYGSRGFVTAATSAGRCAQTLPVPMRTTPALAIVGSPKISDLSVTPVITAIASVSNYMSMEATFTCGAGGMTAGRPANQYWDSDANYIAASARM